MRGTRVAPWVTGLVMAQSACALGLLATTAPLPLANVPIELHWWGLFLLYLAAALSPIEYEVSGQPRWFMLTQFPLALGLVFVPPWQHLAVRVAAYAVELLLIRRQAPIKVVFNLSVGALEVGVATATAHFVAQGFDAGVTRPGPALWATLVTALLVSELATFLTMQALFAVLGVTQSRREVATALTTTVASTMVFAAVAVVLIAALWTDIWTIAVGAALGAALAYSYRKHRRLTAEQKQTTELQQLVQGLGPLNPHEPGGLEVLERIRQLLGARHLDLALRLGDSWVHHVRTDGSTRARESVHETEDHRTDGELRVGGDRITAPLLGTHELLGVLAITASTGKSGRFDPRTTGVLESLAAELANALERGRLQRQLALAATTDALTGLPNLNSMTQQVDRLVSDEAEGILLATVAVDSFREVNDTLGHQVGDNLLLEVTRRLRLASPEALIGRIGGGRFAVAVPAYMQGGDPAMFGLGLRAQVEGGAQLGPVGTHIKLSVGCVHGPEHGTEAATLIRRAETAMYSARLTNGGPVVWEPAYEVEGQRRLAVVMALREALASGAIGVGFQPKVDALTRQVTGVEALARWTHPALGAISPLEFIPLAQAAGLMGPLTSTILRQSLTTCRGWQRRGKGIGVAVNVSADTVLDPSFVTELAAILTSAAMPAELLTLELTEGVLVDDPALASVRLGELRALGVKISVDDFGTGYSSLTYLKGLPVDEVKIDKGFVDGLAHDSADRAVVRAVVDIAHTLGMRVVAEGVEQEEQHTLLAQLGVDEVQGYLHARPMAALDMAHWLRRREQSSAP